MLYDVIVVGGGHSGLEAALASARLGQKTLLVTQKIETICVLSCNPAFGGQAKGGLLREVDALGGYVAYGADRSAIQCRVLGESKGPAARATRDLVDRATYSRLAQEFAFEQKNLTIVAGEAKNVIAEGGRIKSLETSDGKTYLTGALVLTGGTFWNGCLYHGLKPTPGGRVGEPSATLLRQSLINLGHHVGRLSTSTAPRLIADTVNLKKLKEQPGDPLARPFSVLSEKPRNLVSCYLTWTNPQTHKIVSDNLKNSIIFAENPVSAGPRYCPSLEDKIVHFPDRERHQIFLEPDGQGIIFPSGLPTGLPPEVQQALINTIEGMEETVVARPGYAIEYDFCDPTDLAPTLESLEIKGLFMAGQINGTSGYEEAASQGIWAGLGAALRSSGRDPVILGRHQGLIGVMLDDLTVFGVSEPYRMFSSRAEWRLKLREDNADLRLSPLADELGLLDAQRKAHLNRKIEDMAKGKEILAKTKVNPEKALEMGRAMGLAEKDVALAYQLTGLEFLKRPPVKFMHMVYLAPELSDLLPQAALTLETEIKFAGYLSRQEDEIRRLKRQEQLDLPAGLNFQLVPGLTREAVEILTSKKPRTMGQASRLRGVTPASVVALSVYLHKKSHQQEP